MGMHTKKKINSVIFRHRSVRAWIFDDYPPALASGQFPLRAMIPCFWIRIPLIPKVWDAGTNYNSGFSGIGGVKFTTFFTNSLIVTVIGTVGCVLTSLLAAYALSRLKF